MSALVGEGAEPALRAIAAVVACSQRAELLEAAGQAHAAALEVKAVEARALWGTAQQSDAACALATQCLSLASSGDDAPQDGTAAACADCDGDDSGGWGFGMA